MPHRRHHQPSPNTLTNHRQPWSPADSQRLIWSASQLYRDPYMLDRLAETFGRSPNAIRHQLQDGDDWRKAVEVDEAIRQVRPPYDLFVHSSRIPLIDVDLSTPEDNGQLRLLNEECDSGYCWL